MRVRLLFLAFAAVLLLALCACGSPTPAVRPIVEAPTVSPSETAASTATAASTETLAAHLPARLDVTPSSMPFPQQVCDDLTSRGNPGLYVLSLQPYPDLVWDWNPRDFRVYVCNVSPGPSSPGSRFVVNAYFLGESHPRGQTAQLQVQLPTGLRQITLGSWVPGMQNHISACATQPAVQFALAYTFPPDLNVYHPIPYADGQNARHFRSSAEAPFREKQSRAFSVIHRNLPPAL